MPIYDYRCEHCGHAFSAVQSFKDEALEKCPNCGRQPRRLITAPAIVFKGSGWYKTDSRPKSPSEPSSGETKSGTKTDTTDTKVGSPSDAKPKSTPDTKSETKSDTTSDTKVASKPSSGSSGTSEAASS